MKLGWILCDLINLQGLAFLVSDFCWFQVPCGDFSSNLLSLTFSYLLSLNFNIFVNPVLMNWREDSLKGLPIRMRLFFWCRIVVFPWCIGVPSKSQKIKPAIFLTSLHSYMINLITKYTLHTKHKLVFSLFLSRLLL